MYLFKKCSDCEDEYPLNDIRYGLCPDCFDNFQSRDLEDQIEDIIAE